jgi:hypothetical protein
MPFFAERRLSKMSARVKRGAAMLDARCPGWEHGIDLDRLDVASDDAGPLGQLYGDHELGVILLGIWGPRVPSYGFKVGMPSKLLGFEGEDSHAMNLLWANEILVRRRKVASRRLVAPPRANTPVLV